MITQDRQVANLTPDEGKARIVVSVKSKAGSGLSVESRSGSQTKSWLYRPYLNGKQIKITLGAYPAMTLAQAREAHAEAVELVKQGIDPLYVRKTTKRTNAYFFPIVGKLAGLQSGKQANWCTYPVRLRGNISSSSGKRFRFSKGL